MTVWNRFKNQTVNFSLLLPLVAAVVVISLGSSRAFASPEQTLEQPIGETAEPSVPTSFGLFDILRQIQAMPSGEIFWLGDFGRDPLSRALFDLVQYMRNNVQVMTPDEVLSSVPPYRRVEMFGTWVNEDSPVNCYNTRAEVLIRDALPDATGSRSVKFSPTNPCQVIRGEWSDPYSGTDFKLASAVQVDHVIPLKNAYRSGAHAWTKERRCHFANFLRDRDHLLTVSGRENMSKGDSGPEDYIPPNQNYVCSYLANWLRIKAVWNLEFSRDESTAIETSLRNSGCVLNSTTMPLKEIVETRRQTLSSNIKCLPSAPPVLTPALAPLPIPVPAPVPAPMPISAPTSGSTLLAQ